LCASRRSVGSLLSRRGEGSQGHRAGYCSNTACTQQFPAHRAEKLHLKTLL
jgi:hypothetical protein